MAVVSRRRQILRVLMTALAAGAIADVVTLRAQTIGTFTWSHNGEKFEVSCRGDVEFADDDLDVKSFCARERAADRGAA
jgi:hypothetical protein